MSISREVLAKYVKPGCVFLETGSRWGTTLIRAADLGARTVQGCEVDKLHQSISQTILSEVLNGLWEKGCATNWHCSSVEFLKMFPASYGDSILFLDAHSEESSPILDELQVIATWMNKPKVILIDDMRLMQDWGVEVGKLYSMLGEMGYKLSREHGVVEDDILVAQL